MRTFLIGFLCLLWSCLGYIMSFLPDNYNICNLLECLNSFDHTQTRPFMKFYSVMKWALSLNTFCPIFEHWTDHTLMIVFPLFICHGCLLVDNLHMCFINVIKIILQSCPIVCSFVCLDNLKTRKVCETKLMKDKRQTQLWLSTNLCWI